VLISDNGHYRVEGQGISSKPHQSALLNEHHIFEQHNCKLKQFLDPFLIWDQNQESAGHLGRDYDEEFQLMHKTRQGHSGQ
jgi:hypothetical protein